MVGDEPERLDAEMTIDHRSWAEYLLTGADEQRELEPITATVGTLDLEDAYAIQAALIELHIERGDSVSGAKLGLTSVAKQEQMGVDAPVYGWVLESSIVTDGVVQLAELIHPRAEPEIVFVMSENVAGPGVTAHDVLDATAEIVGGIEVIDSRFRAFSFTLPDVIADNTSAARVAVGTDGVAPRAVDLTTLGCVFEVDGTITGTATGAALLGDPAGCVAMLANHLGRYGLQLEAGWSVLAGATTDAKPMTTGATAMARYSHLGSVTVTGS